MRRFAPDVGVAGLQASLRHLFLSPAVKQPFAKATAIYDKTVTRYRCRGRFRHPAGQRCRAASLNQPACYAPHSYCPDGSDAQIRWGRPFCQSRSATNSNTKICDKRALFRPRNSKGMPLGVADRAFGKREFLCIAGAQHHIRVGPVLAISSPCKLFLCAIELRYTAGCCAS
jgi:hypothetical protein